MLVISESHFFLSVPSILLNGIKYILMFRNDFCRVFCQCSAENGRTGGPQGKKVLAMQGVQVLAPQDQCPIQAFGFMTRALYFRTYK